MSGRRTTERDRRRRELGQNFLADRHVLTQFIDGIDVRPGELVVDLGAGDGAVTQALSDAGADVWAVEIDPAWVARLRHRFEANHPARNVRVIGTDLRNLRLPREPYRVVANPPFALTTEILAKLLDQPVRGPQRADLIVQKEVATKLSQQPAASLRAAAWAPWWEPATEGTPPTSLVELTVHLATLDPALRNGQGRPAAKSASGPPPPGNCDTTAQWRPLRSQLPAGSASIWPPAGGGLG